MNFAVADRRCFVQFPHPGHEHKPDSRGRKEWNKFEHKHARKFMEFEGEWVEEDGASSRGILRAWGEWEAESELISKLIQPGQNSQYPRYLWHPFYVPRNSYENLHNTDPFIFGKRFLYSNCRQPRGSRGSGLKRLGRGSVIAFGSGRKIGGEWKWVLDTVLVVADSVEYMTPEARRMLADMTSDAFLTVTGGPLEDNGEASFRLYTGATPDDPVDGMYSFFPAKPVRYDAAFPRPIIYLPGEYLTPSNCRAPKGLRRERSVEELRGLWESLVSQVRREGLVLGTRAALPERREVLAGGIG